MALKDLVCEEISCEHLVQDQWIDFRRSAYRLPDGRVFEPDYWPTPAGITLSPVASTKG